MGYFVFGTGHNIPIYDDWCRVGGVKQALVVRVEDIMIALQCRYPRLGMLS